MAKLRDLLVESGAIVEGHFVYASGKHGRLYVNKTAALVLASHARQYARRIAEMAHFDLDGDVEVVVGPELGAISLMADVRSAVHDLEGKEVAGIMATKIPGTKEFEIVRDQVRFLLGKRTLIVEDILTTGGSAKNAVQAVRIAGGLPLGVAALWNRGGVTAESLGVPKLLSIIDEPLQDWSEGDCPLCASKVPVNTNLGKGKDFLARKAAEA